MGLCFLLHLRLCLLSSLPLLLAVCFLLVWRRGVNVFTFSILSAPVPPSAVRAVWWPWTPSFFCVSPWIQGIHGKGIPFPQLHWISSCALNSAPSFLNGSGLSFFQLRKGRSTEDRTLILSWNGHHTSSQASTVEEAFSRLSCSNPSLSWVVTSVRKSLLNSSGVYCSQKFCTLAGPYSAFRNVLTILADFLPACLAPSLCCR